ncbi:MAG: hypothetical protein ACYTF1_04810 [Planctomycetota bacterium]|jgi:hypothetical protein
MNPLPVSARRLKNRTLKTRGRYIHEADIFPFFDRQGRIKWIMILAPDLPGIHVLPWSTGLFRVPIFGTVNLFDLDTPLQQITEENIKPIQTLWHYDPWWVLDRDDYIGHWAVNQLKATNCVNRFQKNIKMVYFRRDLSRLNMVHIQEKKKRESSYEGWKNTFLPPPAPATPPPTMPLTTTIWSLDPIWKRWTVAPPSFSDAQPPPFPT